MKANNFKKSDLVSTHIHNNKQNVISASVKNGLYGIVKAGIEKRMPLSFECNELDKSNGSNIPPKNFNRVGRSNYKHSSLIGVGMAIIGAVAIAINPKLLPGARNFSNKPT